MTSNSTRWSGNPLNTKIAHSPSSSSSTSIRTPSESSLSTSPSLDMTPAANGYLNGVNGGLGNTRLNGKSREKMSRKKSSPMMPAFIVSAPGKVIVFGEHAVVHGKVCFLGYLGLSLLSAYRKPLRRQLLCGHISSSPLSPNPNEPYLCAFQTLTCRIRGISMSCHGAPFPNPQRRNTITT